MKEFFKRAFNKLLDIIPIIIWLIITILIIYYSSNSKCKIVWWIHWSIKMDCSNSQKWYFESFLLKK